MKKFLLTLFFSIGLIGNSYAEICDEESSVQERNGVVFLPNKTKPFSGQNLCIYDNEQYKVKGEYTEGLKDGKWTNWDKNGIRKTEEIYRLGDIQTKTIFSAKHYQKLEMINYTNGSEVSKTSWDYYSSGQVSEIKNSRNGMLHGLVTTFYENGQTSQITNFITDVANGNVTSWDENGNKNREGRLQNGVFTGILKVWSNDGKLDKEIQFSNGNQVRRTTYTYHNNGQLKRMYSDEDDDSDEWKNILKLVGESVSWYENGQKKQEEHYDDGVLNGIIKSWHENGQLECEGNYKKGKYHGQSICWDENGQMNVNASFEDGKYEGKMSFWYSSGAIQLEADIKNNEGIATFWYESGARAGLMPMKDGKANGTVIEWYENGSKRRSGNVIDDIPDGKQTHFYSQNNQKKLVFNCSNGDPVGEVQGWTLNGQTYNAGGFRDGKGKLLALHENGNKEVEIYFRDGAQISSTYWDENNVKTLEYIYENPDSGYGITKNIYSGGVIEETSFRFGKERLGLCSGYEPFEQGTLYIK